MLRDEFTVWFEGTIECGDPLDMITGVDVLERFGEFMLGWVGGGVVNRVIVGIMLREEIDKRGWPARKELGFRPLRWSGLRWKIPSLQERLDQVNPMFEGWLLPRIEITGQDVDRLGAYDVRDRYEATFGSVPDLGIGLLVREVVRRRGLQVVPILSSRFVGWAGLRWRDDETPPLT